MSSRNSWKNLFSTERHVNLIYFVDAAKTKTIRVSLRSASFIVLGSIFVVVWSFASGYLLVRLQAKQGDLRAELGMSRSVIFEYQAMHDGVFEQAYPELKDRVFSGGRPGEEGDSKIQESSLSAKLIDSQSKKIAPVTPEKPKIAPRAPGDSPVSLSNPGVVRRNGGVEVFFDLRNSDRSTKAEGFIWGVAALETVGGERLSVTVPKAFLVSSTGEPLDVRQGQRFGIRRYARRSFVFQLPPNFKGRVLTATVAFSERNGEYRGNYTIPINLSFDQTAKLTSANPKPDVGAVEDEASTPEAAAPEIDDTDEAPVEDVPQNDDQPASSAG